MKKHEIVVGKSYSNGKGRIRKVIAEGPQYVYYGGQGDRDCIRYETIADGRRVGSEVGKRSNMTRASFAEWAKEASE